MPFQGGLFRVKAGGSWGSVIYFYQISVLDPFILKTYRENLGMLQPDGRQEGEGVN